MSNIILPNPPKFYLVRSQLAGVHIGQLMSYDSATRHAELEGAHRIWRWSGANTWTMTELATNPQLNSNACISARAPGRQVIADVFELLEVTDPAVIEQLRTPRWNR